MVYYPLRVERHLIFSSYQSHLNGGLGRWGDGWVVGQTVPRVKTTMTTRRQRRQHSDIHERHSTREVSFKWRRLQIKIVDLLACYSFVLINRIKFKPSPTKGGVKERQTEIVINTAELCVVSLFCRHHQNHIDIFYN